MIAKTVLSILVAFSFFACDNPSKHRMHFTVAHVLSDDSYDSNGHVFFVIRG